MRFIGLATFFGLAAAPLLPGAALAVFTLTVNPERLNGTFDFVDKDQGPNNTLQFELNGRDGGIQGQVQGNAGEDVVTITYRTDFPNRSGATRQSASLAQNEQVLVTLELVPGLGSSTPAYFGQAAPTRCKAQAKLKDNEANDPDDPDKAQASVSCDLGNGWQELDDDDEPSSAGDPPAAVLSAVDQAFEGRKDVRADTAKGHLTIKLAGEPG